MFSRAAALPTAALLLALASTAQSQTGVLQHHAWNQHPEHPAEYRQAPLPHHPPIYQQHVYPAAAQPYHAVAQPYHAVAQPYPTAVKSHPVPVRPHSVPLRPYSAPAKQYSAPAKQYSAPAKQYSAPAKQYSAPGKQYSAPAKQYSAPAKQYSAPAKQYSAPAKQYTVLTKPLSAPSRQYATPVKTYSTPVKTYATPLKPYPAHTKPFGAPTKPHTGAAKPYSVPAKTRKRPAQAPGKLLPGQYAYPGHLAGAQVTKKRLTPAQLRQIQQWQIAVQLPAGTQVQQGTGGSPPGPAVPGHIWIQVPVPGGVQGGVQPAPAPVPSAPAPPPQVTNEPEQQEQSQGPVEPEQPEQPEEPAVPEQPDYPEEAPETEGAVEPEQPEEAAPIPQPGNLPPSPPEEVVPENVDEVVPEIPDYPEVPEEEVAEGEAPEGVAPEEQVPEEQVPEEQVPEEQGAEGEIPEVPEGGAAEGDAPGTEAAGEGGWTEEPWGTTEPDPAMALLLESCLEPRGQYASPNACNKFVNCWDGFAVEQQCPGGLVFSDAGFCDFADNVDCGARESSKPGVGGETECPTPYGHYRSTESCGLFIVCVAGSPVKFECPDGLNYNTELGVCDYPNRVDCGGIPSERPPSEVTTEEPSEAATESPSESALPDPNTSDPAKKFFKLKNKGTKRVPAKAAARPWQAVRRAPTHGTPYRPY